MERLDLEISFIPTIEASLGKDQLVTAKYAAGGRSIVAWIKAQNTDLHDDVDGGLCYARLVAAVTNALASVTVETGGYCAAGEHVVNQTCTACAAGTHNALDTESALFVELTTAEATCSAASGLYDLTIEQCNQAAGTLFGTALMATRDLGTSWPHGCFNRGDGKYLYNTGGTAGTNTRPTKDPLRVCGIGGDDASGEDTACDGTAAIVAGTAVPRLATPRSVTLLWMQGEEDTKNKKGINIGRYEEHFMILLNQLAADFGFDEINVVIGRLSDSYYDGQLDNWNAIRTIQEDLVAKLPRAALVTTDDLNDGLQAYQGGHREVTNDVHYTVEGYKVFGERLATAALTLLRRPPTPAATTAPTPDFYGAFECMKQNNNIGFIVAKDTAGVSCTAHADVLNRILDACSTDISGTIACAKGFDVDHVLVVVVDGAQDASSCLHVADVSAPSP